MDFKALGDWLSGEISVALHVSFWVAVGVVGLVIWRILERHYQGRLATKDDLIALRNAQLQDYKDKLSGATPDEAKKRIEALERRLNDIAPRNINSEQRARLAEVMRPFEGGHIQIDADGDHHESVHLQQVLLRAFSEANWNISQSASHVVYGQEERLPGMAVFISDPEHPTAAEHALMRELTAFELPYKVGKNAQDGIRIFITARF